MVDKYYNEKGEVGVIISRDYGAGWYSWNRNCQDILFDKELVAMILHAKTCGHFYSELEQIKKYVEEKYPECYIGGLDCGIDVEFVPQGTNFVVREYDGAESIEYINNIDYTTA